MRLVPFALVGLTFAAALEDSHYDLGFETYNDDTWNAVFNAPPAAINAGAMREGVKPKMAAAEHGLNREPVNHAAAKGQAAQQQVRHAAQLQGVQRRVAQNFQEQEQQQQQASPMETSSPEPPGGGSGAQNFVVRPAGDECVATVYSTVTAALWTTTM